MASSFPAILPRAAESAAAGSFRPMAPASPVTPRLTEVPEPFQPLTRPPPWQLKSRVLQSSRKCCNMQSDPLYLSPRANWLCLFKFASPRPTPPLGRSPEPAPPKLALFAPFLLHFAHPPRKSLRHPRPWTNPILLSVTQPITRRKLALFVQIRIAAPHTAAQASPEPAPQNWLCYRRFSFISPIRPANPSAPPPLEESNFALGHPPTHPAQIGFVCSNSHRRAPHRRSGEAPSLPPNWLCSLRFSFISPTRPANPSAPPPLEESSFAFGHPANYPAQIGFVCSNSH